MSNISEKINSIESHLDTAFDTLENKVTNPRNSGKDGFVIVKDSTSFSGTSYKEIPVVSKNPLCFTAKVANAKIGFNTTNTMEYSYDINTWNDYTSGTDITLSNIGDKVYFRGENKTASFGGCIRNNDSINVSGNIMSIVQKDEGCTKIPEVSEFFAGFFNSKTNFTFDGLLLPATVLYEKCYYHMFRGCTSLTIAPELPALKPAGYGNYYEMFKGCTSLVRTQKIAMNTFDVTNTPYVMAYMFNGCTSLNYIEVNFTAWRSSFNDPNGNWVVNVPASGIFVCPSALDTTTRATNRVPSDWTVINGINSNGENTEKEVNESTSSTYILKPNSEIAKITVDSSLTLSAIVSDEDTVGYAEVVLDIASGATVTAGTGITFVDQPVVGKRNICEIRWQDGVAKLRIKYLEDLDESSSSAA